MGYIYKIINKIDGKIYIGQTRQKLEDRFKQHKKIKGNCRYLNSAFKKYGIDNFIFEMVCVCLDEELDEFEIKYITEFNSIVPTGYNLRKGGNGGKQHEETIKKISESLTGRTDIIRNQIRKPHTEETKKKISDSLTGRTFNRSLRIITTISEETKKKN